MTRERVDVHNLGPALTRAVEKVKDAITELTLNVAARCAKAAVAVTDRKQLVDRGLYRRGWNFRKVPGGAEFFNGVPYAGAIEHGRRPGHRFSPAEIDALAGWVRRKLGVRKKAEARSIAFAIAKHIQINGQKPHWVMGEVVDHDLDRFLKEEIARLRLRGRRL